MGATSSVVVMPSGTVVPVPSPTGGSSSGGATALVPAGAGAAFPKPHPGDGSMDFTKTEMVTPETSLNMSIGAFLASLGLEQLREVGHSYSELSVSNCVDVYSSSDGTDAWCICIWHQPV
jgi:hypothetical protein